MERRGDDVHGRWRRIGENQGETRDQRNGVGLAPCAQQDVDPKVALRAGLGKNDARAATGLHRGVAETRDRAKLMAVVSLSPAASLLLGLLVVAPIGCAPGSHERTSDAPAVAPGRLLFADDFAGEAKLHEHWAVEQMPGGSVSVQGGALVIEDKAGCTVWFRERLQTPVVITYEATVSSRARVSDLNCFWMATDPRVPDAPPFAPGFARSGKFEDYDTLRTYYVGCGGNTNSTTRFRRYAGDGTKPLLPEHDLRDAKHLLTPDHAYRITIVVADGRVQFLRDGEIVFDWRDPQPLTAGWFGFRTVDSRIEIRKFRVHASTGPIAAQ
jgi:hypothetical protein